MVENGLIDRILSDANVTADSIVQKAMADAKESILAAQQRATEQKQAVDIALKEEGKKLLERRRTLAEIDAKKTILAAKVKAIDNAFDAALTKLCGLNQKDYTALVIKLLDGYADEGDVVVLAKNAKVDKIALKDSKVCVEKKLVLSQAEGDFCGGIILNGKKFDKSLTFETLLKEQKSLLQTEVLTKLL